MRPSRCSRLLLLTLITLALLHAAASFMCHNKRIGKHSAAKQHTGAGFCETGICYVDCGRSMRDSQEDKIGCAEESHDDGCYDDGPPGSGSGLTCYCSSPLCNTAGTCQRQMDSTAYTYSTATAYTPSIALPLLLLPPMLHYLQ